MCVSQNMMRHFLKRFEPKPKLHCISNRQVITFMLVQVHGGRKRIVRVVWERRTIKPKYALSMTLKVDPVLCPWHWKWIPMPPHPPDFRVVYGLRPGHWALPTAIMAGTSTLKSGVRGCRCKLERKRGCGGLWNRGCGGPSAGCGVCTKYLWYNACF